MKLNTPTSSADVALEHDGVARPAKGERAATHARLMTAPSHSLVTTTAFLKALDPGADRFSFQLFRDPKHRKLEPNPPGLALVHHCGCEEAGALAQTWNTPEWGFGFYVTINETNFAGRRRENIRRVRAVFVDADDDLPGVESQLQGLLPTSAIVRSSAGRAQFYWWVDDFPLEQFERVQRALIAKLRTDTSVYDLPRVMRLPGTLHLKSQPQLVTMTLGGPTRYSMKAIVDGLGLAPFMDAATRSVPSAAIHALPPRTPLPGTSDLAAGIVAPQFDFDKARSAGRLLAERGKLDTRIGWRDYWLFPLTDEAKRHPDLEPQIKQLFDEVCEYSAQYAATRGVKGTDQWATGNDAQWTSAAQRPSQPGDRTIASTYDEAAKHGWRWSPATQQLLPQASGYLAGNFMGSPPDAVPQSSMGSSTNGSNVGGGGFSAPSGTPAPQYQPRSQPVSAMPQTPPKREWLHGVDIMRGAASLVVGPGGRGKSAFLISTSLACASGRPFMGEKIYGEPANNNRLNVLYINAEDQQREIDLRIHGAMVHHNLIANDLPGLYTAGVDKLPLSLLVQIRQAAQLNEPDWQSLEAEIAAVKADVVVIDPLVSVMGGANVNDNAAASVLMKRFVELAARLKVGVVIAHHTSKGSDISSQNAAMGAASLTNLARIQLSLETLAEGDAAKLGVPPAHHKSYFRVLQTKANMSQAQVTDRWFRLASVEVQNARPPRYPKGDSVGVVEPFTPNPHASVLPAAALNAALNAIKNAQPPLSPSPRSPDYAVPTIQAAIAPHMNGGAASTAEAKAALDELMRTGRVRITEVKVARPGNGYYRRDGLEVVGANPTQAKTP